jgi:hypothetical protein
MIAIIDQSTMERSPMSSKSTAALSAVVITGTVVATALMPTLVIAATDADAAAATATCKAQIKEQAKYHEMSWYVRHKAVKNCVKETLAKH